MKIPVENQEHRCETPNIADHLRLRPTVLPPIAGPADLPTGPSHSAISATTSFELENA